MATSRPNNPIELIDARIEAWPLAQPFIISRGSKTEAHVLVVEVSQDGVIGRGEAVPYARYGETPQSALEQVRKIALQNREDLQQTAPAGAARNALDCALWDLESKSKHQRAYEIAKLPPPRHTPTFYTLNLATPGAMAEQASKHRNLPLLKLKLGGEGDADRMRAVRAARPDARLIADANEAWSTDNLERLLNIAAELGFETIEQPLPADDDASLATITRCIPVCADESAHTTSDLVSLQDRYDAVNIKLDKAGGLTEALLMTEKAKALGFKIMVGSMVATSLAIAPALLLAADAEWVDLDSPLLLARDRDHAIEIVNGVISPPASQLWG
ncbi:MAG: dipeptide epimerase [Filomicrobium sp.]